MLGLRIQYVVLRNNLIAQFYIDSSSKPSKSFLTNREVRESISASKLPMGHPLGSMSMETNGDSATWKLFFPFREPKDRVFFTKKGISRILEYHFLREVQRRFPAVKNIVHSRIIGSDRTRFLSRRGLIEPTSVQKVLTELRDEIADSSASARKGVTKHVAYSARASLARKRSAQRSGKIPGPYRMGR